MTNTTNTVHSPEDLQRMARLMHKASLWGKEQCASDPRKYAYFMLGFINSAVALEAFETKTEPKFNTEILDMLEVLKLKANDIAMIKDELGLDKAEEDITNIKEPG